MRNFYKSTLVLMLLFACVSVLGRAAWAHPYEHDRFEWERRHRDFERERECELRVINDSDYEIYIVINERNEGKVWKRSSETFKVRKKPGGEFKVEAELGNETAKKWVTVGRGEHRGEVTFKNDDFKELPER